MDIRPSSGFAVFVVLTGTLLTFLLVFYPGFASPLRRAELETNRQFVKRWRITDICLFPEARYTRHLSQADLHAAFQDHPGARDHFPSGSMAVPPLLSGGSTLLKKSAGVEDAQMD
jgi:hypothetical protein